MSDKAITLVGGNSHPEFARAVAKYLGVKLCDVEVGKFSNGETHVNITELVREQDVYIIQTTATDPNDSLIELLILVDALRRSSARRITAVIPCFGYARQDKKEKSRQPIAAKLVANMIERAGVDRVLTLELHTGQLQGFFNIPVDNLSAHFYLVKYIRRNIPEDKVVVSPGVSSVPRAKKIADELDSDLAIIHFGRLVPGTMKDEVALTLQDMKIVGSVKDKVAILVEDMADTCEALVLMAETLIINGATRVYAVVTHGLLSDKAVERINNSPLTELIMTNSIASAAKQKQCSKLKVINLARFFAEAIRRTHYGDSISALFERQVDNLEMWK